MKLVNTSPDTDIPTEIRIDGLQRNIASEAEVVTIRGASLEEANSFREPDRKPKFDSNILREINGLLRRRAAEIMPDRTG